MAFIGIATLTLFIVGEDPESRALAFDWVPSDEEMQAYRQAWNPPSHGPILNMGADTLHKGTRLFRLFVFGEIGNGNFENQLTTRGTASPFHPDIISPRAIASYGLTDHVQVSASLSGVHWQTNKLAAPDGSGPDAANGVGDGSLFVKYRPIVQDPESWRPSISLFSQIVLPTSKWFGTRPVPGGFEPLGHLPATRFGEIAFTEGVLFRKNVRPFRVSGGVFYTYSPPGSRDGMTTYGGDLVNTRLAFEHLLNEQRGFGYLLELVTLHGLPYRLDGHAMNSKPTSFSLVGVQPSLEYHFLTHDSGARLVGAIGVLFTVAGQNDLSAIYPNISLKYFWTQE